MVDVGCRMKTRRIRETLCCFIRHTLDPSFSIVVVLAGTCCVRSLCQAHTRKAKKLGCEGKHRYKFTKRDFAVYGVYSPLLPSRKSQRLLVLKTKTLYDFTGVTVAIVQRSLFGRLISTLCYTKVEMNGILQSNYVASARNGVEF